jgi:hypothetical protein
MKLIVCNGPVVYRLVAGEAPIKVHGRLLLEDGAARDLLRELREAGPCVAS